MHDMPSGFVSVEVNILELNQWGGSLTTFQCNSVRDGICGLDTHQLGLLGPHGSVGLLRSCHEGRVVSPLCWTFFGPRVFAVIRVETAQVLLYRLEGMKEMGACAV